jgi:hypothetical protein
MACYLDTTFRLLMRRVSEGELSQEEELVTSAMLDACYRKLSEAEILQLEQRLIFLKQATDHMGDEIDG